MQSASIARSFCSSYTRVLKTQWGIALGMLCGEVMV